MEEKEKKPTKAGVYCTDIFFMGPGCLIAVFGIIAIFVVGLFMGVCGLIYLVKSFFFEGSTTVIGGLVVAILTLGSVAICFWIEYIACRKCYTGLKEYARTRRELLSKIEKDD